MIIIVIMANYTKILGMSPFQFYIKSHFINFKVTVWVTLVINSGFENEIFLVSRNFLFMNFDLENGTKNEFKDNNEKSYS